MANKDLLSVNKCAHRKQNHDEIFRSRIFDLYLSSNDVFIVAKTLLFGQTRGQMGLGSRRQDPGLKRIRTDGYHNRNHWAPSTYGLADRKLMESSKQNKTSQDLKPAIRVLSWFTGCYLLPFVGYLGMSQGLWSWFITLNRPEWSAPFGLIVPIWTVANGLLIYASWLAWNAPQCRPRTVGLVTYSAQLVLNAVWPWLYFWKHLAIPTVTLLILVVLLAVFNTIAFWKVNVRSGQFMLPYTAWIAYSAILFTVIWRMNQ